MADTEELIGQKLDRAYDALSVGVLARTREERRGPLSRVLALVSEVLELDQSAPSLASAPPKGSPLSPRETEVLALASAGLGNKQIARALGISHQTVKNHMTSILDVLGAGDRLEAVVVAAGEGWIPPCPVCQASRLRIAAERAKAVLGSASAPYPVDTGR